MSSMGTPPGDSGHYEVWKYEVPIDEGHVFSIYMPAFARVLTAQNQRGKLCLWALVDTKGKQEQRDFVMVGTGHRMLKGKDAGDLLYVNTVQFSEGALIIHVFEFANGRNGR